MEPYFLPQSQLQSLITALHQAGYSCIGPQLRDAAIVFDYLTSAEQLPWGIKDQQSPGKYRLEATNEKRAFAWANGPQGIKPWLFKPRETVWRVVRDTAGKLQFIPQENTDPPLAIFGARACDLAAMAIQDKVLTSDQHRDVRYQQRRERLFLIAVNCSSASANCFCVSAGTGPKATQYYDLSLTELVEGYVIQIGSERGQQLVADLSLSPVSKQQLELAEQQITAAATMQTKRIPFDNQSALRDFLANNLQHPRWQEVAERCLSCGNCTQVCPTCFCHNEVDNATLNGENSEHVREWDSCFTAGHSYLNGRILRDDTLKRYRQWLTHKVGTWFDQFDTSGCVGCGRCITWCPVGIDITEELAVMTGQSNVREATHERS